MNSVIAQDVSYIKELDYIFSKNKSHISHGFDFPVGKPNAEGYYNALKFREKSHLGEDWNGLKGGNSDFDDPIYSISNGLVVSAEDLGGGWGNVIRIVHKLKNNKYAYVESLYAHCSKTLVKKGDFVRKGDLIGKIGNANGKYLAHLHFEIRSKPGQSVGFGYAKIAEDYYISPTNFISINRKIK